jgi:hypothetical protein
MADNIKIVGNITSISSVTRYSSNDLNLINSSKLQENFGGNSDYIEFYIYDTNNNILASSYSYLDYKLPTSSSLTPGSSTLPNTTGNIQTSDVGVVSTSTPSTGSLYPIIEIDPIGDLQRYGYSSGKYIIKYNLFEKKISSPSNRDLFIKEISKDRTEVRLASTTLSNSEIEAFAQSLINEINDSSYYTDYLLNFGQNEQYVAINVALNAVESGYEILFKLYQPLPLSVQTKSKLWVVNEKVLPYNFRINLDTFITPTPPPQLRSPNFDISIPNQGTISTTYGSYQSLVNSLQTLQSSSYQQILSLTTTQSIDINVDYSNFSNFVFFGSVKQRIENIWTKIGQIEFNKYYINYYTPQVSATASLQTTIDQLTLDNNTIISQFDGFESWIYFESDYGYTTYPSPALKVNNISKPYELIYYSSYPTIDTSAQQWYNDMIDAATTYDANNYTNLEYATPSFLKDDTNNAPFILFLNMVGHYFDNIWIYLKSVTDIYKANNNLEVGISKDLVYQQLKSLGVHLYNSQAGESVDQYLVGANIGSSSFDDDFSITGQYLNNIPRKDLLNEIYKRIYHNLPLLVKTKGTVAGLEYLITTFGIPSNTYISGSAISSSILNVKEFGGATKAELINGYNTDKVRIVSNTINGNVLSPLLSLQTFPSASSEFRDGDMHYVDISFSPETQMDTYISGAISSNNPTWRLDDYIGDPRQQYSGSYPDLDTQRKLYFETGVSGIAPFTGSLLDYNGFIRLIQFFDNALFKMLGDFVPERTSLSTGVTINSPVLERNKAVYANPTTSTTESVYTAEYSASTITAQYGHFYDALQDDKKPYFDGALSGSTVDVHQYFVDNFNPYLSLTASLTPSNKNEFIHSDWNVMLNNVSKSVVSNVRKKIEYNWGTTGSITSSAELQDSYLSLRSYNISRYEGSKLTSKFYNNYTYSASLQTFTLPTSNYASPTNASFTIWAALTNTDAIQKLNNAAQSITTAISNQYSITINQVGGTSIGINNGITFIPLSIIETFGNPACKEYRITSAPNTFTAIAGTITVDPQVNLNITSIYKDISYGKTAAIDRKSYKVGWVKNIPSASLNFYDKTQIQLKYLIDKDLNLVDLTLKNTNLVEVQNTFKSGDNVVLSLSDVMKPSFQKTLDGTKTIFRGGYSYDPILYRENNEVLNLRYTSGYVSIVFPGIKAIMTDWYWGRNITSTLYADNGATNPSTPIDITNPSSNFNYSTNGALNITSVAPMATRLSATAYASTYGINNAVYNIATKDATKFSLTGNSLNASLWSSYTAGRYRLSYNYTNPSAPTSVINPNGNLPFTMDDGKRGAYFFDILKFNNTSPLLGGSNTEQNDVTGNGAYLYQAPRSSTYNISSYFTVYTQLSFFDYPDYSTWNAASQFPNSIANTNGKWVYNQLGLNYKLFCVLEKNTNPNNPDSWQYIAATRIKNVAGYNVAGYAPTFDRNHNLIHVASGMGGGQPNNPTNGVKDLSTEIEMELIDDVTGQNIISISLTQGEVLRMRLVMLDIDGFFYYGTKFEIEVGKPQAIPPATKTETGIDVDLIVNNNPNPFFSVTDAVLGIPTYNTLISVSGNTLFTANGNVISFISSSLVDMVSPFVNNNVLYQPTGSTSYLYSPVIDTISAQPQDLIRIGPINNPNPDYYTVITSSLNYVGNSLSTNANGANFNASLQWSTNPFITSNTYASTIKLDFVVSDTTSYTSLNEYVFFNEIYNTTNKEFIVSNIPSTNALNTINNTTFKMYDFLTVESPPRRTVGNVWIKTISLYISVSQNLYNSVWRPSFNSYVLVASGFPATIPFNGTSTAKFTYKRITPTYDVTVDRTIDSTRYNNISQNFAILRPKPDETSVIINFYKEIGEVSQTVLIPQDANDEIKSKIGTIYQTIT